MAGTAAVMRAGEVDTRAQDVGPDVPIAEAALQVRLTREQVLRAVMRGVIQGGLRDGRWYCDRASVAAFTRRPAAAGSR
jgi:hypothetical protein